MDDSPVAPPLPPNATAGDPPEDDSLDPLEWPGVFTDYLPRAGVSLLIAKREVGATTFARTLAYCVARPDILPPFWKSSGESENVLYWMLTARSDPAWERRCRASFDPPEPWHAHLTVAAGMPLSDEDCLLRAMIGKRWCRLAILDALPQYRHPDERPAEPASVIPRLRRIAAATECHILAVLPLSARVRITEDSAHIYRQQYAVDTVFLLRDRSGVCTLTIARAQDAESDAVVLHRDRRTGRVTVGDDWAAVIFAQGSDAIRDALVAGPCTERELEARIGGKRAMVAHMLRDLVAEGMVIRTGGGTRGNPYRYDLRRRD